MLSWIKEQISQKCKQLEYHGDLTLLNRYICVMIKLSYSGSEQVRKRERFGQTMKILVDADACPVKEIIEHIAEERGLRVVMLTDTSHILASDYSEIILVSKAPDAVDFALINRTSKGDIVVTQDYGVAAMALGKGAFVIHPGGKLYTDENIEIMLMERDIAKRRRRAGDRIKGHTSKRTSADDIRFAQAFEKLCQEALKQK